MTVETRITINASKAAVWAATTDIANLVQLLRVTLTGIHETQPQAFTAKLKSLPMVFFKGVIKKAILQDLNDIKASVEYGSR